MYLRSAAALAGLLPALILAIPPAAAQTPDLPVPFPSELPDVSGWEQSWGSIEFGKPSGTLEYRLYVDPDRNGVYGVTYYRIRVRDPEERLHSGVSDNAKLQWIIEAREVRRFECEPMTVPARDGCVWREHARGSAAYEAELGTVLRIYALHRDLLQARDQGELTGR